LRFVPASVDTPGVTVASIDPTGTAADSGIEKGDLILRVQQVAASDPDQVTRALEAVPSTEHAYALALVKRGDVLTWVSCGVLLKTAAWLGRRPLDIISVPKWKRLSGDGNR
jgi:hypothetical protein